MRRRVVPWVALVCSRLVSGCGPYVVEGAQPDPTGTIEVRLQAGGPAPAVTIAIQDVFDPATVFLADCNAQPTPEPPGGPYCDSLFVLPPGVYEVIVHADDPSCATEHASYEAVVERDQTTELAIIIVCLTGAP